MENMEDAIFKNKVEESGIIAFDLIDSRPSLDIIEFDIKDLLYCGMILKEKQFKDLLSEIDSKVYKGKVIAFVCSVETVIPSWAYMAIAVHFDSHVQYADFKGASEIEIDLWKNNLLATDLAGYRDKKVVVRARPNIDPSLYLTASQLLKPVVKTLMYGEIGMPKVIYKK